jgi:hypothetical protein
MLTYADVCKLTYADVSAEEKSRVKVRYNLNADVC